MEALELASACSIRDWPPNEGAVASGERGERDAVDDEIFVVVAAAEVDMMV